MACVATPGLLSLGAADDIPIDRFCTPRPDLAHAFPPSLDATILTASCRSLAPLPPLRRPSPAPALDESLLRRPQPTRQHGPWQGQQPAITGTGTWAAGSCGASHWREVVR